MLFPGDIILTRNTDEVGNESPGYWNHVAIAVGEFRGTEAVVEAQIDLGVAAFDVSHFIARYPRRLVLRHQTKVPDGVSERAIELLGRPYAKLGSLFLNKEGENCVSVVRKAWCWYWRWRRPDHVYETRHKYNFGMGENVDNLGSWVAPSDKWAGRLE